MSLIPQFDLKDYCFRIQSCRLISSLDIQGVYNVENRAQYRYHSSIFKVCMVVNVELSIDLRARYSYIFCISG